MKVKIVTYCEGWHVDTFESADVETSLRVRGYALTGTFRPVGAFPAGVGIKYRREILGQPTIADFLGPMYDGPGAIRYENQAAYDRLST